MKRKQYNNQSPKIEAISSHQQFFLDTPGLLMINVGGTSFIISLQILSTIPKWSIVCTYIEWTEWVSEHRHFRGTHVLRFVNWRWLILPCWGTSNKTKLECFLWRVIMHRSTCGVIFIYIMIHLSSRDCLTMIRKRTNHKTIWLCLREYSSSNLIEIAWRWIQLTARIKRPTAPATLLR